jgi:signal transduction histidine kinase
VLLNLTTNALKFTDRGVVELTAIDVGPDRVELAVRDTGPGIPPEAMEALFQPWRRAKLVPRYSLSSTGLGLAICRRLVAAMGAELKVDTRPGWGTRFHFELELPPAAHTT